MNFHELNENLFFPNFEEYNNFNSNEIFFSPSAYSPIQYNKNNYNDNNPLFNQINNQILNPYQTNHYYQNTNDTNYSSPQLITFSKMPNFNFNNETFSFNEFHDPSIFNNSQSTINQLSNSPLISKIMVQFQEKVAPLLKKFFIDFAKKLINDEPIQIAVIDLDKTSIIDYDIGCYSFPLGIDKFKYKIYNLFDNLKSIARILKLAVIIQNKLNQLRPCTKRELYYENVELFKSTDIIDSSESDLCSILGICRFDLPIFPSAKGLFCGNITLVNKYGNRLNINNSNMNSKINLINYEYLIDEFFIDENTRNSINFSQDNNINNICQKYFVLIVEKETLFFNLVGNYQFYSKFPNSIIITGKGYPDYITKIFIKRLSDQLNNVPFIYFGDHDPHGLEIYLNYMFGSTQSCKENNYMCIGNLKWIGLSHENIETILKFALINNELMKEMYDNGDNNIINEKDITEDEENMKESQTSGLIKLDNKDKTKIKNILRREYFNNDEKWINSNNPNNEKILTNLAIIKNELIQMEKSDYKAEGEYLVSKYFSDFLYLVEQSII